MGYDYRGAASNAGRLGRADRRPVVRHRATRSGPISVACPRRRSSSRVPYYGRAWSTDSAALHARNISGTKYGASATVVYGTAQAYAVQHGRKYDAVEGVAWTAYRRQNCTGDVRLRDARGGRSTTTTRRPSARSTTSSIATTCAGSGIWALGYDGTRPELLRDAQGQVHHRHRPADDQRRHAQHADHLAQRRRAPRHDDAQGRASPVTSASAGSVQPFVDGAAGRAVRVGTLDEQERDVHLGRQDSAGGGVPDGPYRISIWAADASNNRASVQKVVTVDTRRRGHRPRPRHRPPSRPTATARSTRRGSDGRPTRPSPARPGSSARAARAAALDLHARDVGLVDLGRARQRRRDRPRRPLHVPGRRA